MNKNWIQNQANCYKKHESFSMQGEIEWVAMGSA